MKVNLKNRPKPKKFRSTGTQEWLFPEPEEYEEWFEAFEKELRQKLKSYQDLVHFSSSGNYFNQFTDVAYQVAIELIKEILGEKNEG